MKKTRINFNLGFYQDNGTVKLVNGITDEVTYKNRDELNHLIEKTQS